MSFCTVINCMDGRVQVPVNKFLQERFNAEYVDTITEMGPNLILSENKNSQILESIFLKIEKSIVSHSSRGIAVVGHYDCLGNPEPEEVQVQHIHDSVKLIKPQCGNVEIIGLWVDQDWNVHEVVE